MSRAVRARTPDDARQRTRIDAPVPVPASRDKADERRQESRRKPRPNRSLAMPHGRQSGGHWFPRKWPYMILCMVGAIISSAVTVEALPGLYGGVLLGLAVLGACCAQPIFDHVRERST